jgi:hypothetical protein
VEFKSKFFSLKWGFVAGNWPNPLPPFSLLQSQPPYVWCNERPQPSTVIRKDLEKIHP